MKLKEFDRQNSALKRQPAPAFIGISAKRGIFSINKKAVNMLGIIAGDRLSLQQDQEDPENWYIEIGKKTGFILRANGGLDSVLVFTSIAIARQIFSSVGFNGSYGRVLLAGQPTLIGKRTLHGLIVSRLKATV